MLLQILYGYIIFSLLCSGALVMMVIGDRVYSGTDENGSKAGKGDPGPEVGVVSETDTTPELIGSEDRFREVGEFLLAGNRRS